eukprot:TRINITY_DN68205_c0_g1_i1.p1 TRINITY_DN68205_c0_g1~~TRINITY_DN68205_c0_g1_i1.p1  ORF type:complete len:208 (-),score=67.60 TRINITY_DN68205_c0_g1_i1:178-759(-)
MGAGPVCAAPAAVAADDEDSDLKMMDAETFPGSRQAHADLALAATASSIPAGSSMAAIPQPDGVQDAAAVEPAAGDPLPVSDEKTRAPSVKAKAKAKTKAAPKVKVHAVEASSPSADSAEKAAPTAAEEVVKPKPKRKERPPECRVKEEFRAKMTEEEIERHESARERWMNEEKRKAKAREKFGQKLEECQQM